ncbi:N-acetylmuramidase family protein [Roseateles violae]|uniref:N-acetylmuramidase family protein n=1 Tax=Roseateles violae TaxID=3058042 RepID=A0ABT8DV90_9BURK|nr:N-acetylmuramidase family protein [Pelomonas sp. PFR6]MDN3921996.1 N-acetylmuramidase family protein [Pelomonas sp. PFR6]
MSLLTEQMSFLKDVRRLLDYAERQQFLVTGGELERSPETQEIYVRSGREKSMDSPHLRKCAITLNLFRDSNDHFELVQDLATLEPIGKYWEDLDPRNRWGGRRGGVLEAPRFERDPGGWPNSTTATLLPPDQAPAPAEAVALADASRPVAVVLPPSQADSPTPVLKRGSGERDAIGRLQSLLVKAGFLDKSSGAFDDETERAVAEFQRKNSLVADGVAGEKTWTTLLSQTSDAQQQMASRFIGDADFEAAARSLQIETAAMRAVYKVESNGKGFIGDDPKILFEGHVFWNRLKLAGLRPETLVRGNEDILYPTWTKQFYVGGAGEMRRLLRAEGIQREAARESASWGLFQIMGFHWKPLGYGSVDEFVERMKTHERDQLEAFCRFVARNKDRSGRTLAQLLAEKDWAAFAYAYNGAGYRQNAYDDKLRAQYRVFAGTA